MPAKRRALSIVALRNEKGSYNALPFSRQMSDNCSTAK